MNELRRAETPAASRAEPAADRSPGVEFCYVGEAGGVEAELAQRAGIPFRAIATGQVRGQPLPVALKSLWRIGRGIAQCDAILAAFRPDVALLTGGYVAAPVAWAAWRRRVPILIYLPDVTPGAAIRWTSRLATAVAVSFEEVTRYFGDKAIVTGYPVRQELFTTERNAARAALGLTDDLPVLLVMGGSRGARSINRALQRSLSALLPHCQIMHISGTLDWPEVADRAAAITPAELAARYHPYPYLHEMPLALAAADLVVARAGAATLAEFPAVGLPAILVPYPYSGQHQDANAAYLADRGAAIVVKDDELDEQLAPTVLALLAAPERMAAMSRATRALARPDAAAAIARVLYQLASGRR